MAQGKPADEHDLTDEAKADLQMVRDKKEAAERLHSQHRPLWDERYGLYRNYRQLRSDLSGAIENDRDVLVSDYIRDFGGPLFIPWAFTTVETVVPRVVSNDPKMLCLPLKSEATEACKRLNRRYEYDQTKIDYEIKLQATARRGYIYGLGVQKTYWDRCYRHTRKRERSITDSDKYIPNERKRQLVYEGPGAEDVDIYDFFWDPSAKDMRTARYVIHRTWRTFDEVVSKVEAEDWDGIDLESVKGQGSDSDRGAIWQERMNAAGMTDFQIRQGDLHEVWEYHDRDRVITVLNNQLVVQDKKNPHDHGDLPFQIFRPIIVPGEFVGLGGIEPIAHLIYELNTLRQQRRDAATVALNPPVFMQEGALEDNELVLGAGAYNEVWGDPNDVLKVVPLGDIPASGYREEEAIKTDMERTSGVADPVSGSEQAQGATTTATGIQMVQAAANKRIELQAKNLTNETVRNAADQWQSLYAQHGKPEEIRVPDPESPDGYEFVQIKAADYHADYEVVPAAGSMLADSKPQRQQSALQLYQALSANPMVDLTKPTVALLKEHDIPNPESWVREPPPPEPEVDPVQLIAHVLVGIGVKEEAATKVMEQALAQVAEVQQQAEQEQPADPAMNGAPPEPQGATSG